jgi:hypothetical protein
LSRKMPDHDIHRHRIDQIRPTKDDEQRDPDELQAK